MGGSLGADIPEHRSSHSHRLCSGATGLHIRLHRESGSYIGPVPYDRGEADFQQKFHHQTDGDLGIAVFQNGMSPCFELGPRQPLCADVTEH